jgi:hypothetical protein
VLQPFQKNKIKNKNKTKKQVSGLAAYMAKSLIGLDDVSPAWMLFLMVLLTSLITEVSSREVLNSTALKAP